jgi:acylphosphatase
MATTTQHMAQHYLVSGKVQGVGFRQATQARAQVLGISGWVRNLTDGRVEVLASGEAEALSAFSAWIRRGPGAAAVRSVAQGKVEENDLKHIFVISSDADYPIQVGSGAC